MAHSPDRRSDSRPAPQGALGRALANHYVRIYLFLLGLLVVSVAGPEVSERIDRPVGAFGFTVSLGLLVTLVTAFGIAVWKASLVVKHFMHLSVERPIAKLFLAASVLLLALFWGGVAPDVQLHEGRNWENVAAAAAVARGIAEPAEHRDDEHGDEADHASLVPTAKSADNLLPGGYNFAHAAFWTVLVLVAIGTNAVAIMLSIGVLILLHETLSHVPLAARLLGPPVALAMRLPGARRAWAWLADDRPSA